MVKSRISPPTRRASTEPAECRQCPVNHGFDITFFRDVGSNEDRFAAQGVDLGDDVTTFLLTACADDDLRALFGKFDGGGTANPCLTAGDQCDFPCRLTHKMLPPRAAHITIDEWRSVIVAAARVELSCDDHGSG
jgi:hypothetical protein